MRAQAAKITRISQLLPDDRNANKGTERGNAFVARSLREYGLGRSILIDKKGRIIAGNKTVANASALGIKEVQVIQTDGKRIIAVQRMDLDMAKDPKARELALADNRSAELNLEWAGDVLAELGKDIDLTPFFSSKELAKTKDVAFTAAASDEKAPLNHGYGVIIEGISEKQQLTLLQRLNKEGFTCRALTF